MTGFLCVCVAALAYACLSHFIPKYLNKFFLKDNSPIIQGQYKGLNEIIERERVCVCCVTTEKVSQLVTAKEARGLRS